MKSARRKSPALPRLVEQAIRSFGQCISHQLPFCCAHSILSRDVEFDLENDQYRCLHGLDFPVTGKYTPSDVQRVTQIFEHPQFFVNGADSNDIIQGKIGDCWFLSALATVSTAKGLVEKFCVAVSDRPNSSSTLMLISFDRETRRLVFTASSFSAITGGLMSS